MFRKYSANLLENTHAELRLQSNFIEISPRDGFSPVNLLHTFRTLFYKNTFEGLLLRNETRHGRKDNLNFLAILGLAILANIIFLKKKR